MPEVMEILLKAMVPSLPPKPLKMFLERIRILPAIIPASRINFKLGATLAEVMPTKAPQ